VEREIDTGLREGRFELWFEPQCHIASGEIDAFEGLLRLRHPNGEIVPPDAFIGTAEASGQITSLTALAIDQAVEWCARWRDTGRFLRVSVNVSQSGMSDCALLTRAVAACNRHRLATGRITFELTESTLAHDHQALLATMTRLRSKGFQLSLDDFGRGYASLHELRLLPFDELKLDKDVVRTAVDDDRCRAFLEGAVVLASALSLRIVAEGVETAGTLDFVAGLGCEYAQGHFIAQPMRGCDVMPWLDRRKSD
jgi:EAL domain-containing protein (putative c-di-GMP-specific phosphodiesterase class I)